MSDLNSKEAIQSLLSTITKDFKVQMQDNGIPILAEGTTPDDLCSLLGRTYQFHRVANLQLKMLLGAIWTAMDDGKYGNRINKLEEVVGKSNVTYAQSQLRTYGWVYNKWKAHGVRWNMSWTWHRLQDPNNIKEFVKMGGESIQAVPGSGRNNGDGWRQIQCQLSNGRTCKFELSNRKGFQFKTIDEETGEIVMATIQFPVLLGDVVEINNEVRKKVLIYRERDNK